MRIARFCTSFQKCKVVFFTKCGAHVKADRQSHQTGKLELQKAVDGRGRCVDIHGHSRHHRAGQDGPEDEQRDDQIEKDKTDDSRTKEVDCPAQGCHVMSPG